MTNLPKPGEIYRHYKKGERYWVVLLSRNEAKREQILVHYIPLDKPPEDSNGDYIGAWTRTLENFMEEVELGGKKVKRFELIDG